MRTNLLFMLVLCSCTLLVEDPSSPEVDPGAPSPPTSIPDLETSRGTLPALVPLGSGDTAANPGEGEASGSEQVGTAEAPEGSTIGATALAGQACSKLLQRYLGTLHTPASFDPTFCQEFQVRSVTEEVPTALLFALPSNAIPSNALPSNAIPSNALPSNAVPANAGPEETVFLLTPATFPAEVNPDQVFDAVLVRSGGGTAIASCAVVEGGTDAARVLCRTQGGSGEDASLLFVAWTVAAAEREELSLGGYTPSALPEVLPREANLPAPETLPEDPLPETPETPDPVIPDPLPPLACEPWQDEVEGACADLLNAYFRLEEDLTTETGAVFADAVPGSTLRGSRGDGDNHQPMVAVNEFTAMVTKPYPNPLAPESTRAFRMGSDEYLLLPTSLFDRHQGAVAFWLLPQDIGKAGVGEDEADPPPRTLFRLPGFLQVAVGTAGIVHWSGGNILSNPLNLIGDKYLKSAVSLENGTWYHLVLTWGPAGRDIYINGTLSGHDGLGPNIGAEDPVFDEDDPDNFQPCTMAGFPYCSTSEQPEYHEDWDVLQALLDEVRIYPVTPPEEVIRALAGKTAEIGW